MKIGLSLLLLTVALITACESSSKDIRATINEQDSSGDPKKEISYLKFDPDQLEGMELDGFDINETYQIDSFKIIIAFSEGDMVISENPSDWGDGLTLMKGDSILFQSKRVGDPYLYEPFFYHNTTNSKVIIICQLGNEENYGGEAFLLENGSIEFIGKINIENPKETIDNSGLIEMIRISEFENAIYFNFDSDTLIDLTNDDWNRVKNDSIYYVYKEHNFALRGL